MKPSLQLLSLIIVTVLLFQSSLFAKKKRPQLLDRDGAIRLLGEQSRAQREIKEMKDSIAGVEVNLEKLNAQITDISVIALNLQKEIGGIAKEATTIRNRVVQTELASNDEHKHLKERLELASFQLATAKEAALKSAKINLRVTALNLDIEGLTNKINETQKGGASQEEIQKLSQRLLTLNASLKKAEQRSFDENPQYLTALDAYDNANAAYKSVEAVIERKALEHDAYRVVHKKQRDAEQTLAEARKLRTSYINDRGNLQQQQVTLQRKLKSRSDELARLNSLVKENKKFMHKLLKEKKKQEKKQEKRKQSDSRFNERLKEVQT